MYNNSSISSPVPFIQVLVHSEEEEEKEEEKKEKEEGKEEKKLENPMDATSVLMEAKPILSYKQQF